MTEVIKTKGSQIFNVPNNVEGRAFLQLLKKFRNQGWYYRARGRGARHNGFRAHCPQEDADWMAVYLSQEKGATLPIPATPASLREEEEVELSVEELSYVTETLESILYCAKHPDTGEYELPQEEVDLVQRVIKKLS